MGLGDKLIIASGLGLLSSVVTSKEEREAERRRQCALSFDPRLTQRDFHDLILGLAARTPRIKGATINGLVVSLDVTPKSRLGSWTAEVDFNDYGRLTGRHWLVVAPNRDSAIPKQFASRVGQEIARRMSNPAPLGPMGARATGASALATPSPVLAPAARYPDPYRGARLRYWDGRSWTSHTSL